MSNKAKGTRFERRAKKKLEDLGYYVVRNRQSSFKCRGENQFPDLVALRTIGQTPMLIECKVAKYISKEERRKFEHLQNFALCYVAYPVKNTLDKRKTDIVFARYNDYKEVFRL